MAIDKDNNMNNLIDLFIKNSIFITEYESADSIIKNKEHSYNLAKKISKQINKTAEQLLSTELGLNEFSQLLNDKNLIIASSAAEFLYPLYPEKCIQILKKYSQSLNNKLDSYKVDCMIEGFETRQKIFIDQFKKLYNCEDLDSLNRENDM